MNLKQMMGGRTRKVKDGVKDGDVVYLVSKDLTFVKEFSDIESAVAYAQQLHDESGVHTAVSEQYIKGNTYYTNSAWNSEEGYGVRERTWHSNSNTRMGDSRRVSDTQKNSDVRDDIKDALSILVGITKSGYIPFASPAPSSTEVKVKNAINNAISSLYDALDLDESLYGR